MSNRKLKTVLIPIAGGIILLLLDFLIKNIANHNLPYQQKVATDLPFFFLFLTHNTGYHYIFGEINNHTLWAIFGVAVVCFLVFSLLRSLLKEDHGKFYQRIYTLILALMIGASANVWEILFYGYATDYFVFTPLPWPSNLCDQYINLILWIIMPILVIKSILDWWQQHQKKQQKSAN